LQFIGLWFFMATLSGFPRRDYFSVQEINNIGGAPYRLNCWMSGRRFEAILSALMYTKREPPKFCDKFWEVRNLITAWKQNMHDIFSPSYMTCLDESMSIWNNKWSCPGWIFCPRKPHPFGNEWHTISCALSGILFDLEIVEGKDRPKELGKDPSNRFGVTGVYFYVYVDQFTQVEGL